MRLVALFLFLAGCPVTRTLPVAGNECFDGGVRDCEDETTLMCLCNGDDPFASDCGDAGGVWTEQDTLCATCEDWIDDACPVE